MQHLRGLTADALIPGSKLQVESKPAVGIDEWTDKRSTRNAAIFTLHGVMGSEATGERVMQAAGCKEHKAALTASDCKESSENKLEKEQSFLPAVRLIVWSEFTGA
ncbi:hypothetical protein Baya_1011 [Bagarius yarrelli]|uniref:Uncharacterized protein n=1 Tax=Bagarius yarrelli TaxID=175774 RepID=A0A556TJW7_BAGYA|nr:hypothetical protein Baya_1011 [Bagarius yarrelli]